MADQREPIEAGTAPGGYPAFEYRGAVIHATNAKATVTRLLLPGHPMHGFCKGAAGTWCSIVDWWLDHDRLPPWYKTEAAPERG